MAIASARARSDGFEVGSAVSTAATPPRSPGATSTASPTSAARPSACPSPGSPPPRRPWGKATDVTTPAGNTHDDRTGRERFFQRYERHHTPRAVSTGNWSGDLTRQPDLQQARSRTGPVRQERPVYVDLLPPCNSACPAGENIQGWLAQMNAGNHERAWRVLVADNPFPAIHGRVCYHPCETSCNRAQLDSAVSIHSVERFLGDQALEHGWQFIPPTTGTGKRVLVVGCGPSGLSAAYHLAMLGHEVEIQDAGPEPGGMMRYGIPAYRMPRDVLAAEIERISRWAYGWWPIFSH